MQKAVVVEKRVVGIGTWQTLQLVQRLLRQAQADVIGASVIVTLSDDPAVAARNPLAARGIRSRSPVGCKIATFERRT